MIKRIKTILAQASRTKQAEAQAALLVDQVQQIEWRLAMCRSCAHDVAAAHAIAFDVLQKAGAEPFMNSASRYASNKMPLNKIG